MVTIEENRAAAADRGASQKFYFAAWRWHFYAGLYVIPFVIVLAITGIIMLYDNNIESRLGMAHPVVATDSPISVIAQAKAAQETLPGGEVKMYVAPRTPEAAAMFQVNVDGKAHLVAVDPYSGKVLASVVKDDTWYYWADDVHGTLLLGDLGDRLIEIAAGLGFILLASGLYLWWPRNGKSLRAMLVPNIFARRRQWWKEMHGSVSFYSSIILMLFLVSGLSWAGIWGGKFVQAWSTFPAEKWDNVPLSDKTHASMNHGALEEVPWGLEQTKMPVSGSDAGKKGIADGLPVNLDTVAALAREIGFNEQYRINLPSGEDGVYTISADSMDGDTVSPTADRTTHVDRYTGKILAEVGYPDYSVAAKAMAVGIPLHMGRMGLWNLVLNTVFCAAILFIAVSGVVMWWMRRPAGAFRLAPPPMPADMPQWKGAVFLMLFLSLAFPLVGLTLLAIFALDLILFTRVGFVRRVLN
ncbi:PepSY-associated TM helix domain-containing protein [Rhizobium alvei]|uniref:PepSY domain-containing protein n=1 Tax=Rhizobium alvei TaxID=1132659 RepID=A0ABT8YHA3_9HYPH|nr:PepSY domain-containing protein [Rhizobium alvei]MDO6962797.1 PepSY domain-containing protein [Rhizobium alvei]